MKITVKKITDLALMKEAFDSTVNFNTHITEKIAYMLEHSPIRTQEYLIRMEGIPSFVSTHFVRHKIGCEHFVFSNRDDRNNKKSNEGVNRLTPVTHTIKINAEALISLSRKRLCLKSHKETVKVMSLIKNEIKKISPNLALFMVPDCVYRNGICKEGKNTCGKFAKIITKHDYYPLMYIKEIVKSIK